jgi:autotransporter-associated beta strand protein
MKNSPAGGGLRAAILTSACMCAIHTAQAAKTWTGAADATWANVANWQEGALPDTTETVVFNGSSLANLAVDLGAARTIAGISLSNPAGAVALNTNTLTIGKSGIDMSAATQDLTVNSAVTIASEGRQAWNVANGRVLTVAAVPAKPGVPAANTGSLQVSTTGSVVLGAGTANIVADPQGNPWMTYGANDWAGTNAGTVVPSTYTAVDGVVTTTTAGGVVNTITGNVTTANATDMTGLRFNEPVPYDLTVSNSGTSRTMTARGILVTANSAGGSLGGNLRNNAFVRAARASTAGSSFNVIQNSASDFTIGAIVSNGSSGAPVKLVKSGPGKLILLQENGHTGGTYIDQGIVQYGDGSAPSGFVGFGFPGGGDIVNNGELHFRRFADVTLVHNISGSGPLNQYGPGTLNLTTSVSTYTGATNILGGTLGVTSLANLGNGTVLNIDGGAFKFLAAIDPSSKTVTIGSGGATFDSNGLAVTLANPVGTGSTGSLTKTGAGSLSLVAANTYSGGTVVSGGTLLASNGSGSATGSGAVAVNTGGALGGTGTIAGAVNITSGGKLAPGASVGTLTVGSLDLDAGSTLDIEFNTTPANDLVTVTGSGGLTIDGGAITLLQEGTSNAFAAVGTYNLFAYTGAIGGAGPTSLSVANPQPGFLYSFSASGGFVKLEIQTSGVVRDWVTNGSGSWANSANWNGTFPNAQGATANFNLALGAPATVTLDGSKTVGAITFLSGANGYTIAQGSGGSLILNNGASNSSLLDGAGTHTISAPVTMTTNTVIDTAALADSITLSGAVTGGGTLTKTGPGSLALLGSNGFTGSVTLSGGTTTFANGGLGNGNLTMTGSTLVWASGNTQDISNRVVSLDGGIVTFDTNGNDVTLANPIGNFGGASFVKAGLGKLTLGGDTTFTELVTISNGSLQLGSGGPTGSVIGNIINNGELIANRSDLFSVPNVISGTGSLVHAGSGTLELVATNTFSGPTMITNPAATLSVFNGTALQNSTLVYDTAGGTLGFDSNAAATLGALEGSKDLALTNTLAGPVTLTVGGNGAGTTYSGVLSGDGSLTKTGAGTMILTAAQTYTGATSASGGALELDATASISGTSLTVGTNGRFSVFGGSVTMSATSNVTNAGSNAATFEIFEGTATFNGGLNALGNANNGYLIYLAGGTVTTTSMSMGRSSLAFTTEPAAASLTQGLYVNGGSLNITGNLDMATSATANSSVSARIDFGSLTVGGAVTVGLNNGGRWSVLDVNGGTFTSTDAVSGVLLGAATAGNAVMHVHGGTATAERVQFGQGALTGTSVLHVGGGEMFVGTGGLVKGSSDPGFVATVRLDGGVLGAKGSWTSDLPVVTANTFTLHAADALSAPFDITLSGAVTGTGGLVKSGGGTVSLTGTYAYTGSTEINGGTLSLATASLSDTGSVAIATGGVLNLPHGQEDTVAEFLIDGLPQGTGVYSNATHPTLITGTGSIRVAPADPFFDWIDGFTSITNPADKTKTADPDQDGLTNLEEFALNGNPAAGGNSGKVRARVEAVAGNQALVITLPVRNGGVFDNTPGPGADATIDKVVYTVRGSNNLTAFDQGVTEIAVSAADMPALETGWTYHSFRLNGNIGGGTPRGPKGFLDVQIVEAAP